MQVKFFSKFVHVAVLLGISVNSYAQPPHNVAPAGNTTFVDPFIGSTKSNLQTNWGGNGGTYPGAVAPSGNIQLSPETRITGAKGYDYTDHSIFFFSCLKHFSGFPEGSSGQAFILPVVEGIPFEPRKYSRPFNHEEEEARPGYYKVVFKDNQTIAEATAGTHTGILRFTFPAKVTPQIYIGESGKITVAGKRLLQASLENLVINLSADIVDTKPIKDGFLLTFKTLNTQAQTIELKISTSTVGIKSAQQNIDTEIGLRSFDDLRSQTTRDWDTHLAKVTIKDPSLTNKKVFYTALYHSLLIPWIVSDVNGKYQGADGAVHQTSGKHQYAGFSPWDTFRSLHPLLTLLYPAKQQDVILSMLAIYQQTGSLPTESMTGNHAVPIIVDAYLKGVNGYDSNLAYLAMKKSILDGPFVKNDMELYHQLGYVPSTRSESVTRTVEYAYDDWALGQFATLVIKNKMDAQLLEKRGLNYRNLFQSTEQFMLPRQGNTFNLNPGMTGYKEGDKWIYTYFVPHNAKDLINLLGGSTAFSNRLNTALSKHTILYDNETVLHLPYLFNAAGRPDLTQKWIRNIMLNRFSATPGGLPGNDDLGSMSSAYIFNALGLFPVSPGNPSYAIGAPLFESVVLHLDQQREVLIEAQRQSPLNKYVQSLSINGLAYEQLVITHAQLLKSTRLHFVMGPKASQSWPNDRNPVSLSVSKQDAMIKLVNYSVSKKKVNPDEIFKVYFMLKNEGSLGSKQITVYANGKPLGSKFSMVAAGTTRRDSISCQLYGLGTVRIGTNPSAKTIIHVIAPTDTANSPFRIAELSAKPLIELHTEQTVSYWIKNITGKAKTFKPTVQLRTAAQVKDAVLFTDTVSVLPGEQKKIKHHFTLSKGGLHTVKIGHSELKFKVYTSPLTALLLDLNLKEVQGLQVPDSSGFDQRAIWIAGEKTKTDSQIKAPIMTLGDSSYVEIANAKSLDEMGDQLTMMAWVCPLAEEKGLTDLLTKGDSHVLQTNDNQTLSFFAGGWGRGDCTVKLPANWKKTWHHLVGVCNGNLLSVYIDGKLAGSANVEGTLNLSNTSKWQIGRNQEFPSERIFHGQMDAVKIYGQPLLAEDIIKVYNREKGNYLLE